MYNYELLLQSSKAIFCAPKEYLTDDLNSSINPTTKINERKKERKM